jgi:hypothetical protein
LGVDKVEPGDVGESGIDVLDDKCPAQPRSFVVRPGWLGTKERRHANQRCDGGCHRCDDGDPPHSFLLKPG